MSTSVKEVAGVIGGMRIIATPYLPTMRREQYKFPRSKKSRIRKKWRKREENYRDVSAENDIYLLNGTTILASERAFVAIKNLAKSA